MKNKTSKDREYAALADEFGRLDAKMDELQNRKDEIRDAMIVSGRASVDGKLFRIIVSRFEKTSVDYKGLVERLAPPARTVEKFTTTKDCVTVSVKART